MEHDTAGDPMGVGLMWTRRTTEKIGEEMRSLGIEVGAVTVGRLLRAMGYSLQVNHKKISSCSSEKRNEQFEYIEAMRKKFARGRDPIVSVDTKKKELVGNFKNAGSLWTREPLCVNDHDFRSDAEGIAIPYGIYDVQAKRGSIFVGVSHDTPAFAVASLEKWWRYDGSRRYPRTSHLLILADCGGSNGYRNRAWKLGIQKTLCNRHDLKVTVSHYPAGASKWNPIEHELFSEISKNWAGRPLQNYETVLNYIESTRTRTGLHVKAYLDPKLYPKGVGIDDSQMDTLRIRKHPTLPRWNYTLRPKNGR